MANVGHKHKFNEHKYQILCMAMKLFLEKGYHHTTVIDIARESGVDKNTVFYIFKDKETLLSMIVKHVVECQYSVVKELLNKKTNDKLYLYAVETSLQLYMAESSEHLREMYNVSYSLIKPATVIYNTVTEKLCDIFKDYNKDYEMKDFYELELAVSGMMRSYMTVPCNNYFTIESKIKRFLETVFIVFHIPSEKIEKTINFAKTIDYINLKNCTLNKLQSFVENKLKEELWKETISLYLYY